VVEHALRLRHSGDRPQSPARINIQDLDGSIHERRDEQAPPLHVGAEVIDPARDIGKLNRPSLAEVLLPQGTPTQQSDRNQGPESHASKCTLNEPTKVCWVMAVFGATGAPVTELVLPQNGLE